MMRTKQTPFSPLKKSLFTPRAPPACSSYRYCIKPKKAPTLRGYGGLILPCMAEAKTKKKTQELSIDDKRAHAKLLYTSEGVTEQKELARRVGVSVQTMNAWFKKYRDDWEKIRTSMLLTKDAELARLYRRLSFLNDAIDKMEERYDEQLLDAIDNDAINKLESAFIQKSARASDSVSKLTAAINSLETELSLREVIQNCQELVSFTRSEDYEFAKALTGFCDSFIKSKIRK